MEYYLEKCSGNRYRRIGNGGVIVPAYDTIDSVAKHFARHPTSAIYYSVFYYSSDVIEYTKKQGSIADYPGPVGLRHFPFDFDGESALRDLLSVIIRLESYVPRVFFSGNKGYHLYCPIAHFAEPQTDTPEIVKEMARRIKAKCQLESMDLSIYKRTGIIRAPNTRHEKSGLYSIPLKIAELVYYTDERIRQLAEQPRTMSEDFLC